MSEITAKLVGELRGMTGAGLIDCKKALIESGGNIDEAVTILRKKGVASAAKKADRDASEGLVEAYIHMGGKVGVLAEINCETDFVAKTDDFKTLVRDICMHIAAASPTAVSRDSVPEDVIEKEREIAAASVEGKPAHIVQKIVEGKLDKIYQEICLLDQPFVKNPDLTVQDLITAAIAKLGENIQVKRFVRYQIG